MLLVLFFNSTPYLNNTHEFYCYHCASKYSLSLALFHPLSLHIHLVVDRVILDKIGIYISPLHHL